MELARQLDVARGTVQARLDKLQERGVVTGFDPDLHLATLGYGVYLVHIPLCDQVIVPAARAMQERQWPMIIIWPTALTALMVSSLALAYVMHIVIEKPSLRLRERLAG